MWMHHDPKKLSLSTVHSFPSPTFTEHILGTGTHHVLLRGPREKWIVRICLGGTCAVVMMKDIPLQRQLCCCPSKDLSQPGRWANARLLGTSVWLILDTKAQMWLWILPQERGSMASGWWPWDCPKNPCFGNFHCCSWSRGVTQLCVPGRLWSLRSNSRTCWCPVPEVSFRPWARWILRQRESTSLTGAQGGLGSEQGHRAGYRA